MPEPFNISLCVQKFPRPFRCSVITKRTQRPQHGHLQMGFIVDKGYKAKSAKGKGLWDKVQRKPGISFQESSPMEVTWNILNSPSSECDDACEMLLLRKLLQDQMTRVFIGGRSNRQILVHMKIPDSNMKSSVQHKPHCLYKQVSYSEPLLARETSLNLNSQISPKGQACKQSFLKRAISS